MKKFFSMVLALAMVLAYSPAYASAEHDVHHQDSVHMNIADGHEIADNVNRGVTTADWSWTEVMQHSGEEASKGTNASEHLVGAAAGGVIGVRKGIHRLGAGAIDLLTFWIPKKKSLIDPNDPVLK